MANPWNKGFTKETHPSVRKISDTMRNKRIDNFYAWREGMKKFGKIKSDYPKLKKNGDLAELIGVVLGDGHIGEFPRTESLRIVANSNNPGFIERYSTLIYRVFNKKPSVSVRRTSNAANITIYEKEISRRLNIPIGARMNQNMTTPFKNVYQLLQNLGFSPHMSKYKVQISKKVEVYKFKKTIRFREYD